MADKNSVISTLKRSHIATKVRKITLKDFKKAIDFSFPKRRVKMKVSEFGDFDIMDSKKDSDEKMYEKFKIDWTDPAIRGNIFLRFIYLNSDFLSREMGKLQLSILKELNALLKSVGINLGKKVANEYYFGVFDRIFKAYLLVLEDCSWEMLKDKIQEIVGPEFDVKMREEDYYRFLNIFNSLFDNIENIYNYPVNLDGEGLFQEVDIGPNLNFDALVRKPDYPPTEIMEGIDFDIFDQQNEYITFEQDGPQMVVTRGLKGLKGKSYKEDLEAAKKISTKVGKLATKEEADRIAEIGDLVEQKGKNYKKDEKLKVDESKLSKFQLFYHKFKSDLVENEYWQTNVFSILEELSDLSKSPDLLYDKIISALNDNFEAASFLFENRDAIAKDFLGTKRKMESKQKNKKKRRQMSAISTGGIQNSGFGRQPNRGQIYGTEDAARTNHQVLKMLGMNQEQILLEQKVGLKQKDISNPKTFLVAEEIDEEDQEIMDFINIMVEDVPAVMGKTFKKIDLPYYCCFDCQPAQRAKMQEDEELYSISNMPPHLQEAFGTITHLNQLQSKVRECAFESDESMLVCAPTGAGKTNVALLTVLREVDKAYDVKTKVLSDFKIVYISPLKALATEVVDKFSAKLNRLGVVVKEYTGDVGLTKQELQLTNIIVATPEKWDVMTRKTDSITEMVQLIIIDEIHLLDEERGRVLECIVARTLMNVERRQKRIRLLGLSATLPNYVDVARFMQVKKGLFFFSEAYRPVPLFKKFIGVRKPASRKGAKHRKGQEIKPDPNESILRRLFTQRDVMDDVCYDIVRENLVAGEQILIFTHSRADTIKSGKKFLEIAEYREEMNLFKPGEVKNGKVLRPGSLVNNELKGLVKYGLGAHNAGLSRKDRRAMEAAFLSGQLRVVCCTATLAWGVNLPAHAVVIKGTDIYQPGVGWKDMSILDVQQIFGRAGRPQFDEYGEAVLITKIDRLNYFVAMMSCKAPINSQFDSNLMEALNAEISLGNISSLTEAFEYLKRTFWYVRMRKDPIKIGAKAKHEVDSMLLQHIDHRLNKLHKLRMIRYDPTTSVVESTELGRIASHYYINCDTMERFCTYLNFYEENPGAESGSNINVQLDIEDQNLLAILAQASEFSNLQVRPEELDSLNEIKKNSFLPDVGQDFKRLMEGGGKENNDRLQKFSKDNDASKMVDSYEKVMYLIQGYLDMQSYQAYSLVADTHYTVQNGTRILRCIFEICLRKNLAFLAITVLKWCRYIENCIRDDLSPLRMFCFDNVKRGILNIRRGHDIKKNGVFIDDVTVAKVEKWLQKVGDDTYNTYRGIPELRSEPNLQSLLRLSKGEEVRLRRVLNYFPLLEVDYVIKPVAQTILKVDVSITPNFEYSKQFHMGRENFWVMVENRGEILHYEEFGILAKDLMRGKYCDPIEVSFFLPFKGKESEYTLYILSDRFPEADFERRLDMSEVVVHTEKMEYTDLLDLRPLSISTLNHKPFEDLYTHIKYFNPLQTQVFHSLYHTDHNTIIGAPTGSGKTIMAELALLRVFKENPKGKVVYVGPYKALVKERLRDWQKRLARKDGLNKKVLELTGDYTPDLEALVASDVLVTTPEKWDGISRNWQHRSYVTHVSLIIFDEIHLLGQDRGPVIEVIVSRMNYISMKVGRKIRMLGLSTAMANGADVANWFGVPPNYMFNFRPNVRPVPVEIHFKGFSEKNYCPRMNSMNKPASMDIRKFSPSSPVMIFVSSRRQTRLTALDLISLAANQFASSSPYLRMSDEELGNILLEVQDTYLKQTLAFGIGMHHAGLITSDRRIVEKLFVEDKIQILVATSTLAWGVNFPAKLVIIKGTEFFDPKTKSYVDMPISDILQMVGRAGRPQFNDKGYACVYVEKSKKNFYRKYLNDPFPIESCLKDQLSEHINAEIASGTITNKQQCMDYLSWTYFVRRITRNPLFYDVEKSDSKSIQEYLMKLIDKNIEELEDSGCIECEDQFSLTSTMSGYLASFYYIRHKTIKTFARKLNPGLSIYELIQVLAEADEYDEVPCRHNEDNMNDALANICPYPVDRSRLDSPKIKTILLFQAYFSHLPLPIRDYITDTKLVLDNCVRFISAMIDICADKEYLDTLLRLTQLCQMVTQGVWADESALENLPYFDENMINDLRNKKGVEYICQLIELYNSRTLGSVLKQVRPSLRKTEVQEIEDVVKKVPDVDFDVKLYKFDHEEMQPEYNREGISLRREDEVFVNVNIRKRNFKEPMRVCMQNMSKQKDCSWWIVVGDLKENKVLYIKKTFFKKVLKREFQLTVSETSNPELTFFLISDSYIGIDQTVTINLDNYKTPRAPRSKRIQGQQLSSQI